MNIKNHINKIILINHMKKRYYNKRRRYIRKLIFWRNLKFFKTKSKIQIINLLLGLFGIKYFFKF